MSRATSKARASTAQSRASFAAAGAGLPAPALASTREHHQEHGEHRRKATSSTASRVATATRPTSATSKPKASARRLSAPAPADGFAALLAGLRGLLQDHARTLDTDHARALHTALAAIVGKCADFAAAPPGRRELVAHGGSIAGLLCREAGSPEEGEPRDFEVPDELATRDPILARLVADLDAALAFWVFPGSLDRSPLGSSDAANSLAGVVTDATCLALSHLRAPGSRLANESGQGEAILSLLPPGQTGPQPNKAHRALLSRSVDILESLSAAGAALASARMVRRLAAESSPAPAGEADDLLGDLRDELDTVGDALHCAELQLSDVCGLLTGRGHDRMATPMDHARQLRAALHPSATESHVTAEAREQAARAFRSND